MEDLRAQQIEALEVLCDYNERLVKGIHDIIGELDGKRLEDTDKFLENIINGINWEIGVLNGTMTLINEKGERIRKEEMNEGIQELSKALGGKDDKEMAAALTKALPIFEDLGKAAKETLER